MKMDITEWGGRFPGRPYYPVYLSNGVDGMTINMLGSGDCWSELMMDFGAMLPEQRARGWYKCDRRVKPHADVVYGNLFPLFEFASAPILNGDMAVPRTGRQYFDPRTATVTTFYEQLDNETLEWLKVKVTTFLTDEHVLVERYDFLETPESGASMVFFLNTPSPPRLHIYERLVRMDRATVEVAAERSLLQYDYTLGPYRGGACSWFDCPADSGSKGGDEDEVFLHGKIRTCSLRSGESFTRYLAAIDQEDAPDYRARLTSTMAECRDGGYSKIRHRHEEKWRKYFSTSQVTIPDEPLAFVYDVSRYLTRANLHPSGFLPMGNLPYLWQGVMFWDAGFGVQALLGSGNLDEARNVIAHLETYREAGRKLAEQYGSQGMRMEWTAEIDGFTQYPALVTQIHNNSWWAHLIFRYFRATQDRQFLAQQIRLMEELLIFVTGGVLEDRGDHCVVASCSGVDEAVREKINDTWTCAVTLRALEDYREALGVLERTSAIGGLDDLIRKLRAGLEKNVDAQGVMQSFQGGSLPHWGSLIFDLFPDHAALGPTLRKMKENRDPETGLYNFHGVNRYAEKAFPWADCWAARCLAVGGKAGTLPILKGALKSVNAFGGLPERVFYHGELFNNWFLPAHASLVWAVHGMLAVARGKVLRLLGGAPRQWKDVTMAGIHAGEGLVVSARIEGGEIQFLEITNLASEEREIEWVFAGNKQRNLIVLQSGVNRCRERFVTAGGSETHKNIIQRPPRISPEPPEI